MGGVTRPKASRVPVADTVNLSVDLLQDPSRPCCTNSRDCQKFPNFCTHLEMLDLRICMMEVMENKANYRIAGNSLKDERHNSQNVKCYPPILEMAKLLANCATRLPSPTLNLLVLTWVLKQWCPGFEKVPRQWETSRR